MLRTLQIIEGDGAARTFELTEKEIVLGRAPGCQIVLPDTTVSRRQLALVLDGDRYVIEDLGGRNPTHVNGELLREQRPLKDGDHIEVSGIVMVYRETPPAICLEDAECQSSVVGSFDAVGSTSDRDLAAPARKLEAVLHIARTLSRTLELDALLGAILEALFDVFPNADRGLVLLCEADRLTPKACKHREGPAMPVLYSGTIVAKAIAQRQAILSEDVIRDERFEPTESMIEANIRSVICAPLLSQEGPCLGVIQLDTQERRRRFREDDLELVVAVASVVSLAIEYVRAHVKAMQLARLEAEINLARDVQQSFLPRSAPAVEGYRFWAYNRAARKVGGDFYDFVPLPDGRQAVLVADVAGKGVPAALLMAKAATLCRSILSHGQKSVGQLLEEINRQMLTEGDEGKFVTLCLCAVDSRSNTLEMVNAGHYSPVLLRRDGLLAELVDRGSQGLPLGILEDMAYPPTTVELSPEDVILLYTDGVIDALDPAGTRYADRVFDQARELCGRTPAEIGEALLGDIQRHVAGCEQADDLSIVVFGREREGN